MTEARPPQPASTVAGVSVQPVAVVFFREAAADARVTQPVNVYINGQYQTSLVDNNFSEYALCPGQHSLVVAINDAQQRYATKQQRSNFVVGSEPMQYFRVSEDAAGQVRVVPATTAAAQAAVPSLRTRQAHTISRVTRTGCPAA